MRPLRGLLYSASHIAIDINYPCLWYGTATNAMEHRGRVIGAVRVQINATYVAAKSMIT